MKSYLFIGLLMLGLVLPASSAIYSVGNVNGSGTSLNQVILDGNPNGVFSTMNVSGLSGTLGSITITLNVSGGYNGDLYAYLAYNGTLVTLLNRVGTSGSDAFGYETSGFNNVKLADGATDGNIHSVANPGSAPTYSYTPDGGTLSSFAGANPNGTWTLFFADLSGGDVSTLNGWSLDITAVPEPVNVALAIFGGLLGVWGVWGASRKRINPVPTVQ